MSALFGHALSNPDILKGLEPVMPERGLWGQFRYQVLDRWVNQSKVHAIQKGLEMAFFATQTKALGAAPQDAVINTPLSWLGTSGRQGIDDPTGYTFAQLREFVRTCEPAAAIVSTVVEQVAAHAKPAVFHGSHAKEPGFRIKLNVESEQATKEDDKTIADLTQMMMECGWCEPPESETPIGWQPGFAHFLRCTTRDFLTLDWVAIRRWESVDDPKKFPVVAFAPVDAALIRRRRPEILGVQNNRLIMQEYAFERTNVARGIAYVKVEDDGGRVLEEYTKDQMFTRCRRPRTDESARGYGYSEAEEGINAINIWISARDYNGSRFDKDALPRGVMTLLGNFSEQQFSAFTLNWKQMFEGNAKRWGFPVLRGQPGQGSSVTWTPFDESQREMEYSQFLFTVGIWLHAIYHIHPDETGFTAASPFRPPLSEASPDTNLQYSQDRCLQPLLSHTANMFNREILWRIDPTRRYKFEFVGAGNWNEAEDTATRTAKLAGGLTTPRIQWAEIDQALPDPIKDHPAWDLPMPWAQGFALISGAAQQQQQADQAQAQQQGDLSNAAIQSHALAQDPQAIADAQAQRPDSGEEGGADAQFGRVPKPGASSLGGSRGMSKALKGVTLKLIAPSGKTDTHGPN